jgi:hypothetical protein
VFSRQGYAAAIEIDFQYLDTNHLADGDHVAGVFDEPIGEL